MLVVNFVSQNMLVIKSLLELKVTLLCDVKKIVQGMRTCFRAKFDLPIYSGLTARANWKKGDEKCVAGAQFDVLASDKFRLKSLFQQFTV